MTKGYDTSFYRNLILHCLNYTPRMPGEMWYLPEIKTLRTIQYAVNIIRSDYYSWFFTLVSKLPWCGRKAVKHLRNHASCLNLDDKNEEILLTLSLLVQHTHFIVMKYQCFNYIDVAARVLEDVFDKKYRSIINETDSWNQFEHYCEVYLQRKRKFFRDTAAVHESECQTNKKGIFHFWSREEINSLRRVAKGIRQIVESEDRLIFSYDYKDPLIQRIKGFSEISKTQTVEAIEKASEGASQSNDSARNNPKHSKKFCLGCFLSVSYPEVKNKELEILHELLKKKNLNSQEKENDVTAGEPKLGETLTMENSILRVDIDEEPSKLDKNGDSSGVKIDFSMMDHQDSMKLDIDEDRVERVNTDEDPSKLDKNEDFSEVIIDLSTVEHQDSMKLDIDEDRVERVNIDEDPSKLDKNGDFSEVIIDFSTVDHQDSMKLERSEDSSNAPSEDLPLSIIKVLKNILVFGIIALKKRCIRWLKILKDTLKSTLMKMLFYILRVFRRILYFKEPAKVNPVDSDHGSEDSDHGSVNSDHGSGEHALTLKDDFTESNVNPQTLNPASREGTATLKDNCIENKMNPLNLNPTPEKNASTLEEGSLEYKENPPTFDHALEHSSTLKDDSILNVPSSKAKSATRKPRFETYPDFYPTFLEKASHLEDKAAMTLSEAQKESTKKRILSAIESLDMLTLSGDEDPVDELVIDPQEPEIALDSVQTALDWTKRTRVLKRIYSSKREKSFESPVCSSCKTQCYWKFYERLDNYKTYFMTEKSRSKKSNSKV